MEPHPADSASVRPRSIWPMFLGGLLLFALFAFAVVWLRAAVNLTGADEEALRAAQRVEILAKVNEANEAKISGYSWTDKAKGTVSIPVDQALPLALAKLQASPPRPAYPVDPAVPLGSALKPGGLAAPAPTPPPFAAPASAVTPAPATETPMAAPVPPDAPPATNPAEVAP